MKQADFRPGEQEDGYWVVCPACGHKHDDAWEFFTGNRNEHETQTWCASCDTFFQVERVVEVTYKAKLIEAGDA